MPLAFKIVFDPTPSHVHARVFVGKEGGTLAFSGQLALRPQEFRALVGVLEIGCAFHADSPRCEVEPAKEPRLGHCSLCGEARVAKPDGSWGACSFVHCADPDFDVRREQGPIEGALAPAEAAHG